MAGEVDRNLGAAEPCPPGYALHAVVVVSVAAGVIILLALLWYAADVLLLVFAAVLLAVALRGLAGLAGRLMNLSESWSLALVTAVLLSALAGVAVLLAPRVSEQVDELAGNLPRAFDALAERANHYGWARRLMAELPPPTSYSKWAAACWRA